MVFHVLKKESIIWCWRLQPKQTYVNNHVVSWAVQKFEF